MNTILVCSRADAEDLPSRPDWAVISIHDPGAAPAQLRAGWGAVLRLSFHDKEDEALAQATGWWTLFTTGQAQQCLAFIEAHQHQAGLLVHCNAGASRSPAIARAACAVAGLKPQVAWPTGNQLVARRLAEAQAIRTPLKRS